MNYSFSETSERLTDFVSGENNADVSAITSGDVSGDTSGEVWIRYRIFIDLDDLYCIPDAVYLVL